MEQVAPATLPFSLVQPVRVSDDWLRCRRKPPAYVVIHKYEILALPYLK